MEMERWKWRWRDGEMERWRWRDGERLFKPFGQIQRYVFALSGIVHVNIFHTKTNSVTHSVYLDCDKTRMKGKFNRLLNLSCLLQFIYVCMLAQSVVWKSITYVGTFKIVQVWLSVIVPGNEVFCFVIFFHACICRMNMEPPIRLLLGLRSFSLEEQSQDDVWTIYWSTHPS